MTYRIEYRFNWQGREPHCFDVFDATGRCVRVFRSACPATAKGNAEAWTEGAPDWLATLAEPHRSEALADLGKAGAS